MQPSKSSTSAERMKKYREKKKQDPDYLRKERERLKLLKRKKKESLSKQEQEDLKMKKREEKRQERERKKVLEEDLFLLTSTSTAVLKTNEKEFYPYKCKQTFSKAVLKCLRSLPCCPLKTKCVIRGVARHVGIELVTKMDHNLDDTRNDEMVQMAKDLFKT